MTPHHKGWELKLLIPRMQSEKKRICDIDLRATSRRALLMTYVSEKIRVAPLGAIVTQPASSSGNSSAVGKPYFPLAEGTTRIGLSIILKQYRKEEKSRLHCCKFQNRCLLASELAGLT